MHVSEDYDDYLKNVKMDSYFHDVFFYVNFRVNSALKSRHEETHPNLISRIKASPIKYF